MQKSWILIGTASVALAACSEAQEMSYDSAEAPANEYSMSVDAEAADEAVADVAEASADAQASNSDIPSDTSEPSVANAPQIAYKYALGFRLPTGAIKPLQEKHADMCEARGPKVCRIISMRQADEDGDYGYGNLQLAVAAGSAREFSKELEGSSKAADAETISSSIEGEDLSKQIVDTEARLRARTLLRDRLMDILRNRQGTVAELVEAERGVAQVNQEIDQATSWLNEMRGRVAFSQMAISYETGTRSAGGFGEPIRNAWNSLGGIFGGLIAFLIIAGALVIPLGLIGWGIYRLWRMVRPKTQFGASHANEEPVTRDDLELPADT